MKKTSTITNAIFKKFLVGILTFLGLIFSQAGYAHSVDSYSGTCASGPQYKVTAVVSNVNSTSNYRWQWKNSSNAWVCFTNGANTINGTSYNVSGAVYNLTTTPGPIIFTNPNSGLQGLEIRMVISDGSGVNPCTLPSGNTWTSTTNHFINVANTPCSPCNATVTGLYFNKLDNGPDLPINNGSTFSVTQLGSLYNLEASTTGTVGSVKFTVTGPTPTTNIENSIPYNSPGGNSVWTGAPGNYSVNVKVYQGSNATGNLCDEITITFILANTLSLGDRVWYDTNNDGIENNGEAGVRGVTVKLYKNTGTGNTPEAAAIATDVTDANGNYSFSGLAAGNYIVGIVMPNGYMKSAVNGGDPDNNIDKDNNGVNVVGNEVRGLAITLVAGSEPSGGGYINNTYDFGILPDCTCTNSAGNLLTNASFENGTTGWSWSSSNGSLTTGTGYVACGSKNGFNNQSSGTSKVWQDVTMSVGQVVTFSAFAGTHTPGISCSPKLSLIFLNSSNSVLAQTDVTVTRDVDLNNSQLEQYTITATAPANTAKVRVQSSITCNTMKLDAFCLTATPACNVNAGTNGSTSVCDNSSTAINLYNIITGEQTGGTWSRVSGTGGTFVAASGTFTPATGATTSVFRYVVTGTAPCANDTSFATVNITAKPNAGTNGSTSVCDTLATAVNLYNIITGEQSGGTWTRLTGTGGTFNAAAGTFIPAVGATNSTFQYSVGSAPCTPATSVATVTILNCQLLTLGNRVWYDTNNNGINDASENGIRNVTVKLYADANNDNIPDGAAIATTTTDVNGYYQFTGLSNGNYIVGVVMPAGYMSSAVNGGDPDNNIDLDDNGQVLVGNEIRGLAITLASGTEPGGSTNNTYDFGLLPDCDCTNSAGNLLVNGSFENGTTGWSWSAANGSLTTGTGYVACGAKNGFNNWTSGTSKVWQDVNVSAGSIVTFSAFAGTHTPGITCSPKLSLIFLNGANAVIGQTDVTVTRDVDINNSQLEQYSITAVAPAGTVKARVQSSITCNTMKLDAFCLTEAPNCAGAGTWNLSLPNGTLGTSQAYTVNGITVMAYGFNNGSPGTATALYGKNEGPSETGLGINSDPDHEIDINHFVQIDLNQIIAAGITSGTMTIGSMQAGEPANVYGSNTLGTRGTLLMTVPVTFDDTPFAIPGFPTYRYYSVQASTPTPANVLLEQVSFGCPPPNTGSIGDRVWVDTNKDGVQDAGEVGLAGVTVTLFDGTTNNVLASTVTDAYGNYKFSNLATSSAGINYQVRFSLVPGYKFSPNTGAVTVATNSDANATTGRTTTITLTNAAPTVTYVDAGMYYTESARLGDFVWNDINKNGIQDAGEPGIAGVTVMLYTAGNVMYRSTITSNNGYYAFNEVPAGSYYVKVALPIGYQVSPKDAGADDVDSDIDPVTGNTGNYTVVAGTKNLTIDAGLNVTETTGPSASLGDKVWHDLNNNNLQDAGEPGIPNVTVQLYSSANVLLKTTTTDAFGNYIFNGLAPGSYYVKFTLAGGFGFVTANVGSDDTIDSDAGAGGVSQTVTLIADEINTTVDAGMRLTTAGASLGDYVWYDLNKNGIQDGGAEIGVPGVTVLLYNSANAVVASTTTDANGFYLFTGLPASTTYTVGFENIPAGYGFSPNAGAVTVANNSDVNPSTGRTGTVTTGAAGSIVTYVDAGIIDKPTVFDSKATVGDRVWNDLNNNGIQDAGEPGLAGVIVTLYAANGTTVIATTTTDALGNYLFTNLDAGSYVVGFSGLPAGYVFATKDAGTDDTKDSDADITTGKTAPFSLAAGEINLTIDAGARNSTTTLSAIGNYVWYDVNGNGIQDATETGAAGVSVALKNSTAVVIKTTTTDASGLYLFTDLAAGTYTVQFGNLPAGYVATTKNAAGSTPANNSDADATTLSTDNIVLPASTTDLTWDFGIKTTTRASLGDYVWDDANQNGIQDATEFGVAGVTVTLYDNLNVATASTITDAKGFYLFSNLLPNTYSVGFSNIPVSSTFTTQNAAGSTAANNSDANPATGKTATFSLAAGQSKTDIDAGLVSLKAAVGDYVWHDINRDGIQDAGELGVAGVTVTLFKSTDGIIGNGDDVAVASAVTGANGYYFINNVPVAAAGSQFYIRYTDVQTGYLAFTTPLVGGTSASDNSKVTQSDLNNGRTGFFTLNPGQIYRDMDAGVYKPINISGHVFNDANGLTDLQINQTGPQALPNSLYVYLVDAATNQIVQLETFNPVDHSYSFLNVDINHSYKIVLSTVFSLPGNLAPIALLPSGWQRVGENLGAGPLSGSDGVPNGLLFIDTETSDIFEANFGIRVKTGEIIIG